MTKCTSLNADFVTNASWFSNTVFCKQPHFPFCHTIMKIKICAEYRDMLPMPRLVCQEPGLRPIGRNLLLPWKSDQQNYEKKMYFSKQTNLYLIPFLWSISKRKLYRNFFTICHLDTASSVCTSVWHVFNRNRAAITGIITPPVPHTYVTASGQHWFRKRL